MPPIAGELCNYATIGRVTKRMTLEQIGTFLLGHAVATFGFYTATVVIRGGTPPRWMVPHYLISDADPDDPPRLSPRALAEARFVLTFASVVAFITGILIAREAFY